MHRLAGTLRDRDGGILSLAALIEEHGRAVEADLIDKGLRLRWLADETRSGAQELTWADLAAVVWSATASSAIGRALNPEWMWGLPEMLAADIADSLRWLTWAKTSDAQKGRNRPKPIPRPGVTKPERIGVATPIADMNEFLGWEVA